ncbi:MAG: hypothetical protein JRH18_13655 [Deltaproteobacteria bacterium]|nr:hypothetical protein [Deltaproteobacteria bacterium]MBW1962140.1 hypothetical protein [Deltaproteobacteria bacterium]MBW2152701.1 hypothetical protein [Deltaproteobacteria bacterium]
MAVRVLIIGVGDAGGKISDGLARSGKVDELILSGLCQGRGPAIAGMLDSCYDCRVKFTELDGTQQKAIERLLKMEKPDLVVQSASLLGPWAMHGRTDPVARALSRAGLGVQLPAQLPVLATVMKAIREVDFKAPIANLSFPDISHVILDRLGLAPTIGLGNVSICHLRTQAALRNKMKQSNALSDSLPLIRLVGHHHQVYEVMEAKMPQDPDQRCRVYLGEEGRRSDELAYQGFPILASIQYNIITAASALPVLLALLPGAEPLRFSAPGPHGLPGGYPVMIKDGGVGLDLPEGVDLKEAVEFHWKMSRLDGIESVTKDGTVLFSEKARKAVANINPALCEPLQFQECLPRYRLLMRHINA